VEEFVPVRVREGVASFTMVTTCQSIWACPVCSAAKRQERAEQTDARARAWLAAGHGLLFVTLTMPHTIADDLPSLLAVLSGAWRRVQQHSAWRATAENLGVVGALRATEITHGYNGWHPHSHVLLWTERPVTQRQCDLLSVHLYERWADAVEAEGLRRPSAEHGVRALRVTTGAGALAKYLMKTQDGYDQAQWSASTEMLRGDLKKGRSKHRSYFEVAEAAVRGDLGAQQLVRVYERATRGRRCQEMSRNLAKRLREEVDGHLEEAVTPTVTVYELSNHEWNVLRSTGLALALLCSVELDLERGQPPGPGATRIVHRAFDRYRAAVAKRGRGDPPRGMPAAVVA
jgi:hypothetical protein